MAELLTEEDFIELPEEAEHKWIQLEKTARARLSAELEEEDRDELQLKHHYMHIVKSLAEAYGVQDISIYNNQSVDTAFTDFSLAVSRARARIWANSTATFPLGRVALPEDTKAAILVLAGEIEQQINSLKDGERRKATLHQKLEDFRREINQPRTRIGSALTTLAQVSTVVAMSTASLAEGPDAYATILRLLGAAHTSDSAPEIRLIESEFRLLLPSPPKQIEGPHSDDAVK
ncbi:MAG: hypothetical protein P1U53_15290 [Sulfitobacter sp.]|uniref:hypothetical protein n=1 Tax=Antarcticimicrobium sp. TaxID=2824147 RepID=UPI002630C744|nr:hypothetical protein [Antarcticimicrobium sp.]MDF1716753.1 hypothetical protein [Antarcticimicrobium sp.]MDF1729104.1 hypothetical protein [Sulfitobacter sp.]